MSSTPSVVPDLQASSTYIDAPSSDRWHTWEKVALQCVCVWGGGGRRILVWYCLLMGDVFCNWKCPIARPPIEPSKQDVTWFSMNWCRLNPSEPEHMIPPLVINIGPRPIYRPYLVHTLISGLIKERHACTYILRRMYCMYIIMYVPRYVCIVCMYVCMYVCM